MATATEELRACMSPRLIELCKAAEKKGYSRQADTPKVERTIDMDGVALLQLALAFHNESDHHRCRVMFPIKGVDPSTPGILWLDVSTTDWDSLPTVEQVLAAINDKEGDD